MTEKILVICSLVLNISAVGALFFKPLRNKLLGLNEIREGQKCLLRSDMLSIYYKAKEQDGVIRQYEFENFALLYAAYKAEGGNTFIDKIKDEVFSMEVVS